MKTTLLAALAIFATAVSAQAGSESHGGDVARCAPSTANKLAGIYSLDYLVTYDFGNANADIVEVASWEASVARLRALIADRVPVWLASFEDFVATVGNRHDLKRNRIWRSGPTALIDMKDERLVRTLPQNCLRSASEPDTAQTVVRKLMGEMIVYEYDEALLNELMTRHPLQASFLLIHEWLWDKTSNIHALRLVNRLLHSRDFEELPPAEVVAALGRVGVLSHGEIWDIREDLAYQLCRAVISDDIVGVRTALRRGAKHNMRCGPYSYEEAQKLGVTAFFLSEPLGHACANGSSEALRLLVQSGGTVSADCINRAVRENRISEAKAIDVEFSVKYAESAEARELFKYAVSGSSIQLLKAVLDVGFRPVTLEDWGVIGGKGTARTLTDLISAGVDVMRRFEGTPVVYYEHAKGGCRLFSCLAKAAMLEQDLLSLAAFSGNAELLEVLVKSGQLNVNRLYRVEKTSRRGKKVSRPNVFGDSLLSIVKDKKSSDRRSSGWSNTEEVLKILKAHGAVEISKELP